MEHMIELKNSLNKISDFIEDKDDVIFIDFPFHHNVGDLLILAGTIKFFENYSINIKMHLSANNINYNLIKKNITDNTTILCHGGGNFGDIYSLHQELRESILREFPRNRIIILPQTAFFSNQDNMSKSKEIFRSHNNLIMFARDKVTYDMFKNFTDNTYLMPDMAHELYGILPKSLVSKKTLYFLRKDVEQNPIQHQIEEEIKNSDCFDWDIIITKSDKRVTSIIWKLIGLNNRVKSKSLNELIFKIWYKHTLILVTRASKIFSSYENVVTSRLHGHILSCLLDIPSSLVDNSYGKNKAYYEVWTKDLAITSLRKE